MTTTTQFTLNLGPSDIIGGEGDSPFALSRSEWSTLQRYVLEGIYLPTTEYTMRQAIRMLPTDDIKLFDPLLDAYKNVKAHCSEWHYTIFPETVHLSNDIRNYSTKAPIYYKKINEFADKLILNPKDEVSKQKLEAYLKNLSDEAVHYASNAEHVKKQIEGFAQNSLDDQQKLNVLHPHYQEMFGERSQEAQRLAKQLQENREILRQANQDYEYHANIVGKSRTFLWLGLLGLVAASIAAGDHSTQATEALQKAEEAQAKINALEGENIRNTKLGNNIEAALLNMTTIEKSLGEALPVILKVKGVWTALASDLNYVVEILDKDIAQASVLIVDAGVDLAIAQWEKVGKIADDYVANAFITIGNQPPALVFQNSF